MKVRLVAACAMAATVTALSPVLASEAQGQGQFEWNGHTEAVGELNCEMQGDGFVVDARGDGIRLRLNFMGEGSLDSVDFSLPARVDLTFAPEHPQHPRAQFAMGRSLGDMGESTASPESVEGSLDLRPGNGPGLEAIAEGVSVRYRFNCDPSQA